MSVQTSQSQHSNSPVYDLFNSQNCITANYLLQSNNFFGGNSEISICEEQPENSPIQLEQSLESNQRQKLTYEEYKPIPSKNYEENSSPQKEQAIPYNFSDSAEVLKGEFMNQSFDPKSIYKNIASQSKSIFDEKSIKIELVKDQQQPKNLFGYNRIQYETEDLTPVFNTFDTYKTHNNKADMIEKNQITLKSSSASLVSYDQNKLSKSEEDRLIPIGPPPYQKQKVINGEILSSMKIMGESISIEKNKASSSSLAAMYNSRPKINNEKPKEYQEQKIEILNDKKAIDEIKKSKIEEPSKNQILSKPCNPSTINIGKLKQFASLIKKIPGSVCQDGKPNLALLEQLTNKVVKKDLKSQENEKKSIINQETKIIVSTKINEPTSVELKRDIKTEKPSKNLITNDKVNNLIEKANDVVEKVEMPTKINNEKINLSQIKNHRLLDKLLDKVESKTHFLPEEKSKQLNRIIDDQKKSKIFENLRLSFDNQKNKQIMMPTAEQETKNTSVIQTTNHLKSKISPSPKPLESKPSINDNNNSNIQPNKNEANILNLIKAKFPNQAKNMNTQQLSNLLNQMNNINKQNKCVFNQSNQANEENLKISISPIKQIKEVKNEKTANEFSKISDISILNSIQNTPSNYLMLNSKINPIKSKDLTIENKSIETRDTSLSYSKSLFDEEVITDIELDDKSKKKFSSFIQNPPFFLIDMKDNNPIESMDVVRNLNHSFCLADQNLSISSLDNVILENMDTKNIDSSLLSKDLDPTYPLDNINFLEEQYSFNPSFSDKILKNNICKETDNLNINENKIMNHDIQMNYIFSDDKLDQKFLTSFKKRLHSQGNYLNQIIKKEKKLDLDIKITRRSLNFAMTEIERLIKMTEDKETSEIDDLITVYSLSSSDFQSVLHEQMFITALIIQCHFSKKKLNNNIKIINKMLSSKITPISKNDQLEITFPKKNSFNIKEKAIFEKGFRTKNSQYNIFNHEFLISSKLPSLHNSSKKISPLRSSKNNIRNPYNEVATTSRGMEEVPLIRPAINETPLNNIILDQNENLEHKEDDDDNNKISNNDNRTNVFITKKIKVNQKGINLPNEVIVNRKSPNKIDKKSDISRKSTMTGPRSDEASTPISNMLYSSQSPSILKAKKNWTRLSNVFRSMVLFKNEQVRSIQKFVQSTILNSSLKKLIQEDMAMDMDTYIPIEIMHKNSTNSRQFNEQDEAFDLIRRVELFCECASIGSEKHIKIMTNLLENDPKKYILGKEDPNHLLNKKNSHGHTPLYIAAKNGNLFVVDLLIKNKANYLEYSLVNNKIEEKSLQCAVRWGHLKVVQYMLNKCEFFKEDIDECLKLTDNNAIKLALMTYKQSKFGNNNSKFKCCLKLFCQKKAKSIVFSNIFGFSCLFLAQLAFFSQFNLLSF